MHGTNGRAPEIDAEHPRYLLAEGEHAGYRWIVAHNGVGCRCGYVRIPPGHPWHGRPPADVQARAHGSVNWWRLSPAGNWWLGFDFAHAWDLPDPELPLDEPEMAAVNAEIRAIYARHPVIGEATVRSQAYVEDECRRLCEQAAEAAKGGGP